MNFCLRRSEFIWSKLDQPWFGNDFFRGFFLTKKLRFCQNIKIIFKNLNFKNEIYEQFRIGNKSIFFKSKKKSR